jgi:diguanylate cyclase (GGDEF)-like protein
MASPREGAFPEHLKATFDRIQTALEKQFARIEWQHATEQKAYTDSLTGLYNKHYLQEQFVRFGEERTPFTLVIGDVDFFKKINDTFGHPAGDAVLKQVGAIFLQFAVRHGGFVCRYGGEEIVWILPDSPFIQGVAAAESLREFISVSPFPHGQQVTMSLGAAHFPTSSLSTNGVLAVADKALYTAKQTGRNKVMAYGTQSISGVSAHSG